jgi:hypothetical protein
VRSVAPPVQGLDVRVLNTDEFLELRNDSGKTVVVEGYDGEPYLRFKPDGTVQQNALAPATYLNADRRGLTPIPKQANAKAPPRWKVVARGGKYHWFDHRIHLTTKGTPRELRNLKTKKKVFNWTVPVSVDHRPARVLGTLFWNPKGASSASNFSTLGIIVILVIAALALLGLLVLIRRRGRASAGPRAGGRPGGEAW